MHSRSATSTLRLPSGYHSYARELVNRGFAVLTPLNLRSVERRNRIELDLRDGGHESHVESGMRFLTRWLKEKPVD